MSQGRQRIPEVTREQHYHALNNSSDGMGYCYELYVDKVRIISKGKFFAALATWISRQRGNFGLVSGCERIKQFYSEKFA